MAQRGLRNHSFNFKANVADLQRSSRGQMLGVRLSLLLVMNEERFTWIKTRDGSPTLWSNELGEPFRSSKGAFTESWVVFVAPGLEYARTLTRPVSLAEFGLGVGTNWILWSLASLDLGIQHKYFVIERDLSFFEAGLSMWRNQANLLYHFLRDQGSAISISQVESFLKNPHLPEIFSTIEAVPVNYQADIWFHDPFGFSVNPEGYSPELIALCARHWAPGCIGTSYACNKNFRNALETIEGVSSQILPSGHDELKRERLVFRKKI